MSSKLTLDPRLTKAEANLDMARELIQKMTPAIGDPDPTTLALKYLATSVEALTKVLQEKDAAKS